MYCRMAALADLQCEVVACGFRACDGGGSVLLPCRVEPAGIGNMGIFRQENSLEGENFRRKCEILVFII